MKKTTIIALLVLVFTGCAIKKYNTIAEFSATIPHGDIEALADASWGYNHTVMADLPYEKAALETIRTGDGDCYNKMAVVKVILDEWGWYNKYISLKRKGAAGHSLIYFEELGGVKYGIISNGVIYYDVDLFDFDRIKNIGGSYDKVKLKP